MISDTLSDAVADIEKYLHCYPDSYPKEMRKKIVGVLRHMNEVRKFIDHENATLGQRGK